MKKNILITVCCAFLVSNLYAQVKKDIAYYNHRIDSFISVYSVENYMDTRFSDVDFNNSNLDTEEKKKLISKIRKLFEQKEYTNLYRLGCQFLYSMWWELSSVNSLEIKQMLMEIYLQYYFYPARNNIIDMYDLNNKSYYTKKAKKRIVELLENKKTEEEYELFIKNRVSYYKPSTYGWDVAERIIKKREIQNDSTLKQIRDSLLTKFIYQSAKEDFESDQIKPDLIRMIGILDMKECIPVLKQKLTHCIENDCLYGQEKAYRYALTHLGDTEQRQYILDNLMDIENFHKEDFTFFQDDEMVWKYIEVNYSSGKSISVLSDVHVPANVMTMSDVQPYIKNLPEELMPPETFNSEEDAIWAKDLYNWLISNKATVKFDYEGEKEWYWQHMYAD